MSNDPLDVSLHDRELHDEGALTAHLIIAATESDEHLSQDEIDRLLGLWVDGSPTSPVLTEHDAVYRVNSATPPLPARAF